MIQPWGQTLRCSTVMQLCGGDQGPGKAKKRSTHPSRIRFCQKNNQLSPSHPTSCLTTNRCLYTFPTGHTPSLHPPPPPSPPPQHHTAIDRGAHAGNSSTTQQCATLSLPAGQSSSNMHYTLVNHLPDEFTTHEPSSSSSSNPRNSTVRACTHSRLQPSCVTHPTTSPSLVPHIQAATHWSQAWWQQ